MDDGHYTGNGLILNTDAFPHEDVCLLVDMLVRKYGWKATIRNKGNYFTIYIWAKSMRDVAMTVQKHVHPSMAYKLGQYWVVSF